MFKRIKVAAVATAVAASLVAGGVALAGSSKVTGGGQTKRGATLAFVANADHSGHLTYVRHSTSAKLECGRFHSFHSLKTAKGYPKVVVTAKQCFRRDGKRRYLKAVFIDRGEPGGSDIARVMWAKRWPATRRTVVKRDRGVISNGNIQVH